MTTPRGPESSGSPRPPEISGPPEMHQRIESLWARLIDANTGTITRKTRSMLSDALSQKKLDELLTKGRASGPKKTPVMKRHGMDNILKELTASGIGMIPHIHSRMKQKMHDEKAPSIDEFPLIVSAAGAETLGHLVRNPDTDAALALAWLYSEVVTAANWMHFADIFDSVSEAEVRNADALQKMQGIYRELKQDKAYVGIGLDPSEDAAGVGSGRLKKLRSDAQDAHDAAKDASKTVSSGGTMMKGEAGPFLEEKKRAEQQMETLTQKRTELGNKLTQFNMHLKTLRACDITGAALPIPGLSNIDLFAQTFSMAQLATNIPQLSTGQVEIAGTTQEISSWLESDDLAPKAKQAINQYRQAGTGLIPAEMALDRLSRRVIGTPVGMEKEDAEKLHTGVLQRMLSGNGPQGDASHDAAHKPGMFQKIFGFGKRHGATEGGGASHKPAKKGRIGRILKYLWEH